MLYLLGQDQILFKPLDSEEPYTLDNGLRLSIAGLIWLLLV